jgi:ABC-2 type transport system permease protein
MFTIIRTELWQRRWSLLWWCVGVGAFVGLDVALYVTVKDDAAELNQLLARMPAAFRALFADGADFLSPEGFLSARIYYLLLPLLLTILGIGLGTSLIGKEEKQGTLELLLARPVSRTRLLIAKVLAGLTIVATVGVVAMVVAVVTAHPAGIDLSRKNIILTTLASVLLSLLFGVIAFLLSALGKPFRSGAAGIAALIAFASYLIASLESLVEWLKWPALFSPYHYYHPTAMLAGNESGTRIMLAYLAGILVIGIAAWIGFRRRDLDAN